MSRKRGAQMSEAAAIVSPLLTRIREIWRTARIQAARSVSSALLQANWLIGQQIVETEQGGFARAEYGGELLKTLSEQLIKVLVSGFSVRALQSMWAFYVAYPSLMSGFNTRRVLNPAPAWLTV